jgi:hypothetical protein
VVVACAAPVRHGTLAELGTVEPDLDEIYLEDGLERAAESYRRYLEETPESARTPEAMRRLADLQIEQEYGVIGGGGAAVAGPGELHSGGIVEMAAPESAAPVKMSAIAEPSGSGPAEPTESELAFEERIRGFRRDAASRWRADSGRTTGSDRDLQEDPRDLPELRA